MSEDEIVIICVAVASARTTIKGARLANCSVCRKAIWVAPSSRRLKARNPETKLMCIPCAFDHCPPETPVELAPGQFAELARTHPDAAAWIYKAVQRGLTLDEIRRIEEWGTTSS